MTEPYLKHLAVAVIGAASGFIAYTTPEYTSEAFILWGVILAYIFKNGHAAVTNGAIKRRRFDDDE